MSVNAWAQNDIESNKRTLPNYAHTISMGIENNQLIIREQSIKDSFDLNENLGLKNIGDTTAILNALHFEQAQLIDLTDQYNPHGDRTNLNLIQEIIKRAKQLEGDRIIFVGNGDTLADPTEEAMYTPNAEPEENSFDIMRWLFVLLGLIGGLLLGVLLGKRMNKKKVPENNISVDKKSSDTDVLEKTKTELAQIKTSLQQQLDFDKQYFEQSFNTVIIPLEKALEARDTKTIMPLLIKAMAHYTAVTRFKLEKKQSFDLANMQIMMGKSSFEKSDFPTINKNTSPDDIPNKLKALITLLKNAEANGVDNSIVSGYKISNL